MGKNDPMTRLTIWSVIVCLEMAVTGACTPVPVYESTSPAPYGAPAPQPSSPPNHYSYQQGEQGAGGTPQITRPAASDVCSEAFLRGRWDEAISACSKEIEASPGSFHAHNYRGLAYFQKNDLDRALADFNMTSKIAPQDSVPFINMATAHYRKGMPDLALADLRRAEALTESATSPDDVAFKSSTLSSIGRSYLELKQYDLALQAFRKSQAMATFSGNLEGIGECHSRMGNHREAAVHFMRATEMDPNIARYHMRLGQEYYSLGRYDEAIQTMETGLLKARSDAEREQLNFHLAYSYVAKGDYKRASAILGQRKTLGVQILQAEGGMRVNGVHKGGPADLAGLLTGDLMVEFNGEPLQSRTLKEFTDGLERTPFGSTAQIRILRDGRHLSKQVIVGVTPNLAAATPKDPPGSSQTGAYAPPHPSPSQPPRPSLEIHKVETTPPAVSPGSAFDLTLEFTVTAASEGSTQIPVEFTYQILEGERIAFGSKANRLEVAHGVRTSRVVHLTASKKKGRYAVKVLLQHGDRAAEATTPLLIE